MAAALIERARRESTPETVEDDLAALWRDLAAGGNVARAVMSNLVSFRFRERRVDGSREPAPANDGAGRGTDAADAALEAVAALHPSRVIVIEHDRGQHDPGAPVAARVAVRIFGPPAARYGIEEVVVQSACAEISLPSIVRRFARGHLPTSVWWTEDLSLSPPLPALVATGRQLVYDSRSWRDVPAGFRALAPLARARHVDLADLNWRRLAPLRRALLHAAERMGADAALAPVRIAYRPGDEALGWLLAGWLAARLQWSRDRWASVAPAGGPDEVLSLAIGEDGARLAAVLDAHRVVVRQPHVPPMTVPAPCESDAESVAAELRSLSYDAALHDAIAAVASRGVES